MNKKLLTAVAITILCAALESAESARHLDDDMISGQVLDVHDSSVIIDVEQGDERIDYNHTIINVTLQDLAEGSRLPESLIGFWVYATLDRSLSPNNWTGSVYSQESQAPALVNKSFSELALRPYPRVEA